MKKALFAYIPVPHKGYFNLIERHNPDRIYLITPEYIRAIDEQLGSILARDWELRAIESSITAGIFWDKYHIPTSVLADDDMVAADTRVVLLESHFEKDISGVIITHQQLINYEFDNYYVRWDWGKVNVPKSIDGKYPVSTSSEDRYMMSMARLEMDKSSDFWRQVGAAVKIGSRILTAYNRHRPHDSGPYLYGDQRLYMQPGERPEVCGALHAEKSIIAQIAASKDLSSQGASIYVTTFPCSDCARALQEAGFSKVFYGEGYSNLDAAEIFEEAGIMVTQVQ